jgi:hypothetical protein
MNAYCPQGMFVNFLNIKFLGNPSGGCSMRTRGWTDVLSEPNKFSAWLHTFALKCHASWRVIEIRQINFNLICVVYRQTKCLNARAEIGEIFFKRLP